MPTIDISAKMKARAAEREKNGNDPVILKYKDWKEVLPVELPAEFAKAARTRDLDAMLLCLVEEQAASNFWKLRPSLNDVNDITEGIMEAYGFVEGESKPSEDS